MIEGLRSQGPSSIACRWFQSIRGFRVPWLLWWWLQWFWSWKKAHSLCVLVGYIALFLVIFLVTDRKKCAVEITDEKYIDTICSCMFLHVFNLLNEIYGFQHDLLLIVQKPFFKFSFCSFWVCDLNIKDRCFEVND